MTAPDWGYLTHGTLDAILRASSHGEGHDDAQGRAPERRVRLLAKTLPHDADELPSALDDVAVFAGLRAGDRTILDQLYRATYADLCQFAFTYVRSAELADEVVQDVFVALIARQHRLPFAGTVRGYLFTAVRNSALNALRTARRTSAASERLTRDASIVASDSAFMPSDASVDVNDRQRAVARAVHALPERQQRAVLLRYAAQLSFAEIAGALGLSPDAARMLVNRATAELRRQLATVLGQLDL